MISTKRPEWEIIFNTGKKKKKSLLEAPICQNFLREVEDTSLHISANSPASWVILWSGVWDRGDLGPSFGLFPIKVVCYRKFSYNKD